MKKEIHPTYFKDANIICACGNKLSVGSTKEEIRVEVCSNCHPFFTGSAKFVDTEGRVERFQRQTKEAQTLKATASSQKKDDKKQQKEQTTPQTLREMMEMLKKTS